jgi:hypothetical protein
MSRSTALDPVVTRTGTTKLVVPTVTRVVSIALDPICRRFTTASGQTVVPDVAR